MIAEQSSFVKDNKELKTVALRQVQQYPVVMLSGTIIAQICLALGPNVHQEACHKAVYIPSMEDILLGRVKKTIQKGRRKEHAERNTKDDVDTEIFSLCRFLELLMEGQTVALDMLFANPHLYTHLSSKTAPYWQEIFDNREKLLTKNVQAFVGYARQQAAKYGIKGSRMDALKRTKEFLEGLLIEKKLKDYHYTIVKFEAKCAELLSLEKTPLVEIVMLKGPKGLMDAPHLRVNGRNIPFHSTVKYALEVVTKMLDGYGQRAKKAHLAGGIDWKALSHAVRVNEEAKELLLTGNITFPRPERELLVKIKKGEVPYDTVAEMIEQGLAELYEAREKSTLREEPDRVWADAFLLKVYAEAVR